MIPLDLPCALAQYPGVLTVQHRLYHRTRSTMKNSVFVSTLGAVALLFAPALANAQDDGAVLRPRYNPGFTYEFSQDQKMTMVISPPGTDQKLETKVSSEFGMTAVATQRDDADGVKVVTTIDVIKMEMNNPALGGKMGFDSTAPDDGTNPLAGPFKAMLGKELVLFYDTEGAVERVEGFDEFMKSAGGASMFTEEQFVQMADPAAMMGLDNQPKKIGDKWNASPDADLGEMGKVSMPMELTYSKNETFEGNECARIDMDGSAEIKLNLPEGQGGGNVTSNDSKTDGYYLIDAKLGMLRKSLMNMNLTMNMNVGGQQMVMPMQQVATYRLNSVKKTE